MHGTRSANASKHPGYIVKPPTTRRTHAEVEAEKLAKKAAAAAAAAAKRAALHAVAEMEVQQRELEMAEEAEAARPASSRTKAALEEGGSDDEWENLHNGMKRGMARRGTARGGRGQGRGGKATVAATDPLNTDGGDALTNSEVSGRTRGNGKGRGRGNKRGRGRGSGKGKATTAADTQDMGDVDVLMDDEVGGGDRGSQQEQDQDAGRRKETIADVGIPSADGEDALMYGEDGDVEPLVRLSIASIKTN
jgi:hypothetical protein